MNKKKTQRNNKIINIALAALVAEMKYIQDHLLTFQQT